MIEDTLTLDLYAATTLFMQKIRGYNQDEQERIVTALYTAAEYHSTQKRKSGQLYIIHPIQVATILASIEADAATVMAGLLHDVLEDTTCSPEELQRRFGVEVYTLVEAVTHQPMFSQKEFFEKIYNKSKSDPRIAYIKIADQCSNHVHGSQLVFTVAKHLEHLEEMHHFYGEQLATIPEIPRELVSLLQRITEDSTNYYTRRTQ